MFTHTFLKNLTAFDCNILNVNNGKKNIYSPSTKFFKDKYEHTSDYSDNVKYIQYDTKIKYYELDDRITKRFNGNNSYKEYSKLFNELYNELVTKDLNSDIKNFYHNDKNLKPNTIIKFKNLLYLNQKILYILYDSDIYKENLTSKISNNEIFNITKEQINFYKNHCLNSGNMWDDFDKDTVDDIKNRYFNEFTPAEFLKLCNNMKNFYGDTWFCELQKFLNGDWNNNTHPIRMHYYLTNNHYYNSFDKYYKLSYNIKLNNDYHKFIFESLKPELPIWLKGTLLEEIINEISKDMYNSDKEREFIEQYSSIYDFRKN